MTERRYIIGSTTLTADEEHFAKYDAIAKKLGVSALIALLPGHDERVPVMGLDAEIRGCRDVGNGLPRNAARAAEQVLAGVHRARTAEEWRRLVAEDEHLNSIPLLKWDLRHDAVIELQRVAALRDGDKSFSSSLCTTVCVLKHVAKHYAVKDSLEARP